MPIEIFRGDVISADTKPYGVAEPGDYAFVRHELLGNTHFLGVQCNKDDDGGVIRSFPFPDSDDPNDHTDELRKRHFDVALDLDTIECGGSRQITLRYGVGELGRIVTFVAVHTPDQTAQQATKDTQQPAFK